MSDPDLPERVLSSVAGAVVDNQEVLITDELTDTIDQGLKILLGVESRNQDED
jgi:D-Tyr-tRNAtyr deacylase